MSESNDEGGVVAVETSNEAPIEVESRLLSDDVPQEGEQYQQTWMDYYRR